MTESDGVSSNSVTPVNQRGQHQEFAAFLDVLRRIDGVDPQPVGDEDDQVTWRNGPPLRAVVLRLEEAGQLTSAYFDLDPMLGAMCAATLPGGRSVILFAGVDDRVLMLAYLRGIAGSTWTSTPAPNG